MIEKPKNTNGLLLFVMGYKYIPSLVFLIINEVAKRYKFTSSRIKLSHSTYDSETWQLFQTFTLEQIDRKHFFKCI